MSTIVTRAGKGSPLTHVEVDANFTNLDTDKVEKTAAAITGGTINGTTIGATTATTGAFTTLTSTGGAVNGTIGATTPAAGTFTTITGQTEVLKGTGQNLLTYSNTFTNGVWTTTVTVAANSTTDPFGGSTASTITSTNQTYGGLLRQYVTTLATPYTATVYVKYNNWNYIGLRVDGLTNGNLYSYFNFSNSTANLNGVTGTFTATSVGSGWYRLVLTGTTTANPSLSTVFDIAVVSATGDSSANTGAGNAVYVYGAQLEIGSTANTYVATTSAAIYGTPTLSFSGVSTIGLQSDGSLYVSPAGTGALQAQATTSTTAGGNARGANAVDWQMSRSAASQVASGSNSVVVGGRRNTASATDAFVGGGFSNSVTAGSQSAIVSGSNITNSANNAGFVGGGTSHTVSGDYSSIVGGYSNTTAGTYNFIGGGFTNSGTASAAVTTQSGTMNGTTAVTLSGSNASIKVGQLIVGTSITYFPGTYVAAISGTSLTLSQAASGSSTSTLSFFTPHGVVVGGGNNQATGSYSFIGGGGDAGTAANRNVASGDWSFVGGGRGNTSSGNWSATGGGSGNANTGSWASIGGGSANGIYANYGTIGGGLVNGVTGFAASVLGGYGNSASGTYSSVVSGIFGTSRSITSSTVVASSSTITSSVGISQAAILVLAKQTTDATATVLTSNELAASGTNQVILPNNSAYFFTGEVVSGVTGGGNTKGWTIEGVIKRGANAASTALVGTPTVTSSFADAGASTWVIAVTADTTNGGLAVTFTGQASTTIRTVCRISTVEMTY